MSVFKLDRDAFDRQLAAMEANGQAFEKAQSASAVAAHSAAAELAKSGSSGASGASFGLSGSSGGVQWSGVGELVQFGSPLQSTAVMVDEEMSIASRLEKAGVAKLRASLASFTQLNEAERQAYLARLAAVDEKFTYRRPEEMAGIVSAYSQARAAFDAASKLGGK